MTKRLMIEAALVVALVVAAAAATSPTVPAEGPDMSGDVCGTSERFVVQSKYIGCTRGGTIPLTGGGSTYGFDQSGRSVVYWSSRDDPWWQKLKCAVSAGSCPIWAGELTPDEIAQARKYFGLTNG